MNDTADMQTPNDTLLLTQVPSGKTCMLVGIVGKGRFRRRGKHHHRHKSTREAFEKHKGKRPRKGLLKHFDHDEHEWRGFRRLRILRRLLDLGITKGCSFKVVQGSSSGPVLVEVRGTRVALGQGLSNKMLVKVVKE